VVKANSLCHRGVRAMNGHLITRANKRNEFAPPHLLDHLVG
jgi:hypothetical protein